MNRSNENDENVPSGVTTTDIDPDRDTRTGSGATTPASHFGTVEADDEEEDE